MRKIWLIIIAVVCALQAMAQFPPRIEDHFWRRKVINRIDLEEKINKPLVKPESSYYRGGEGDAGYAGKDGVVAALFTGLRENKYTAYDPDTLTVMLSFDDVIQRINRINAEATAETDLEEAGDASMDSDDGEFDSFEGESGGGDDPFADPFADSFADSGADTFGEEEEDDLGTASTASAMGASKSNDLPDLQPFEMVIQFVEDRIFDKNRSSMVRDIQYIEIIWVDIYGRLPERKLATFAYEEVLETLDQVQWKNRFNDAEYRTMREVFEMGLYHSYIINISGQGIQSLAESEYRRQQLTEFEHHLWSY